MPTFAWFAQSNNQGQHIVGITATAWYAKDYHNLQCPLDFIPTKFTVSANVSSSIIVRSNGTATIEPDPTGLLVSNTFLSLEFLFNMSPSLYIYAPVVGDAFQYNVNTANKLFHKLTRSEAVLRAIEALFEAILDDILGIYRGTQAGIAHDTTSTTMQGTFDSFLLGKPFVHYLALLVNLVIVLGIVIEGTRTRFWRDLPRCDVMDFTGTVTAASFGGNDLSSKIWQQYNEEHQNGNKNKSKRWTTEKWTAHPGDRKLGSIAVCMQQDGLEEPKIMLPSKGHILTLGKADEDDTEMDHHDDGTASLETDSSIVTMWSPVELHNE